MDGGANRWVSESDVIVIDTYLDCNVDIRGIDNHEITDIPLETAWGVTSTIIGEIIVILHQHKCDGNNKNIYSSPQIDHCKNIEDDSSLKVGSRQHITTLDKCKMSMIIRGN